MDAGKLTFEIVQFDLWDLVEKTCKTHSARAKPKKHVLEHSFTEGVAVYWMGDPYRLLQVINNLLVNAIKFTEQGKILISLTRKHGGGMVHEDLDCRRRFS